MPDAVTLLLIPSHLLRKYPIPINSLVSKLTSLMATLSCVTKSVARYILP